MIMIQQIVDIGHFPLSDRSMGMPGAITHRWSVEASGDSTLELLFGMRFENYGSE